MTAHDQYKLYVGAIGLNRKEYLYDIPFWELLQIKRGYFMRHREMWSATRWQTYNLMAVSMKDIKQAGVHKPADLIPFPWEHSQTSTDGSGRIPTQEEADRMRQDIIEYNRQREALLNGNPPTTLSPVSDNAH